MLSTGRLLLVFLRSLLWLELSGCSTWVDGFRMSSLLSGSECCLAAGLLFPCDFSSSDPTPLCGGSSIPETWARKLQRLTPRLRSHGVPCAALWPQLSPEASLNSGWGNKCCFWWAGWRSHAASGMSRWEGRGRLRASSRARSRLSHSLSRVLGVGPSFSRLLFLGFGTFKNIVSWIISSYSFASLSFFLDVRSARLILRIMSLPLYCPFVVLVLFYGKFP